MNATRGCDQEDPVSGLGEFFHDWRAEMGVFILAARKMLKNHCVECKAERGRQRAGSESSQTMRRDTNL